MSWYSIILVGLVVSYFVSIFMDWIPVAILVSFVISYFVSSAYSAFCRPSKNSAERNWQGAMEANATFFALAFLMFWLSSNKSGSWVFGAIGSALAFFVAWRFWTNFERPS